MESVSTVVEENRASTEEMAAGASEITGAVESIASISQENSAAVEEVDTSAEECASKCRKWPPQPKCSPGWPANCKRW